MRTAQGCPLIEIMRQPGHSHASTGIKVLIGADIIPTVFTIVANAILLLTIAKTKSLHTPSNMLLAALCFSDLLVGVVSQPVFLALLLKIELFQDPTRTMTRLVQLSGMVLNGMSFTIVLFITIDRYVAVCHPFFYHIQSSIKRYFILLLITWLYKILVPILGGSFYFYLYAALTTLSFSVMFFCYMKICSVIVQKERTVLRLGRIGDEERKILQCNREERSKAGTILIILIIFILTYLPSLVVIIVIFRPGKGAYLCTLSPEWYVVFMWCIFFYNISSVVNPIVYCIRMKAIKKGVKNFLFNRTNRVHAA